MQFEHFLQGCVISLFNSNTNYDVFILQVRQGITSCRLGPGTSVHIEDSFAPRCLLFHDWLTVITGLGFNTLSPETSKCIGYTEVTVSQSTDELVLTGFNHIINALKGLLFSLVSLEPNDFSGFK